MFQHNEFPKATLIIDEEGRSRGEENVEDMDFDKKGWVPKPKLGIYPK